MGERSEAMGSRFIAAVSALLLVQLVSSQVASAEIAATRAVPGPVVAPVSAPFPSVPRVVSPPSGGPIRIPIENRAVAALETFQPVRKASELTSVTDGRTPPNPTLLGSIAERIVGSGSIPSAPTYTGRPSARATQQGLSRTTARSRCPCPRLAAIGMRRSSSLKSPDAAALVCDRPMSAEWLRGDQEIRC